jgi:tetratricopeptide (TPR) repeat protein
MKRMRPKMNRWTRAKVVLAAGLILAWGGAGWAAVLVLGNGSRVEGRNLRLNAQGDYVLETAQGLRTYAAGQVQRAEADKPAGYDEALALRATQPEEASRRLTQIARANRGLGWDGRAWYAVAGIAAAQGRHDQAAAALEQLPAHMMETDEVRGTYLTALVQTGNYAKAMPLLDEAIRRSGRALSARATLLRGDARLQQGQQEPALLDYLRVWMMYADVRELQPEALYKAAGALAALKDPRAAELKAELERDYPNSTWAALARRGE